MVMISMTMMRDFFGRVGTKRMAMKMNMSKRTKKKVKRKKVKEKGVEDDKFSYLTRIIYPHPHIMRQAQPKN